MPLSISNEKNLSCHPFLRWAGGKKWFIKYKNELFPKRIENYHEPFLGGGSVFFSMNNAEEYYLSDLNTDLINTYIQIRDNVNAVIKALKKYKNTEEVYYQVRNQKLTSLVNKAAQFIYLNKTSFNGIYRVNRNGLYNVPYGYRTNIDLVDIDVLQKASNKLQKTHLLAQDFEQAFQKVKKGDFVFIDPPYTVAHENNGFVSYNQKIFSLDDQYRLSNELIKLNKIGAHFLMTNAYHDKIAEIYSKVGVQYYLERKSLIGGKGAKRENVKEFIIKNY